MSELVTDLTLGVYRRLYSNFINGQRICKLSRDAECWFWRVYATVDDFGNAQADPVLCLAATKGRRAERITVKQVEKWLKEMFEVGLITFYWVKNEPYLHINQFCEKWQPKGRNGKQVMRFPGLEMADGDSRCIQVNPDLTNAPDPDSYSDPHAYSDIQPPFGGMEFLEALASFERHRKQLKKKITEESRRRLYATFSAMGEDRATAAIHYSIEKGWTGVFEDKTNRPPSNSKVDQKFAAGERAREQLRRERDDQNRKPA